MPTAVHRPTSRTVLAVLAAVVGAAVAVYLATADAVWSLVPVLLAVAVVRRILRRPPAGPSDAEA